MLAESLRRTPPESSRYNALTYGFFVSFVTCLHRSGLIFLWLHNLLTQAIITCKSNRYGLASQSSPSWQWPIGFEIESLMTVMKEMYRSLVKYLYVSLLRKIKEGSLMSCIPPISFHLSPFFSVRSLLGEALIFPCCEVLVHIIGLTVNIDLFLADADNICFPSYERQKRLKLR